MNENAGFFSGDWLGAFLIIAVMFGGFGGNGLGWGGNNAALTQMLQDRLDDARSALANAQDIANNSAQSAYLLSQLGKFVINAPATAG